jgi:hypothetical protein
MYSLQVLRRIDDYMVALPPSVFVELKDAQAAMRECNEDEVRIVTATRTGTRIAISSGAEVWTDCLT